MSGPYTLAPSSPLKALSAATTGNGGVLQVHGRCHVLTIALQSEGTTSGGVVTIEEAREDPDVLGGLDYTGTWSTILAVNASDFTGTAQKTIHVLGSFWAVRTRISSTITGGGTVSSWIWAN